MFYNEINNGFFNRYVSHFFNFIVKSKILVNLEEFEFFDKINNDLSENLSIFSHPRQPFLKNTVRGRYLIEIKFKHAHNYVLFNYDEFRSFIQ